MTTRALLLKIPAAIRTMCTAKLRTVREDVCESKSAIEERIRRRQGRLFKRFEVLH